MLHKILLIVVVVISLLFDNTRSDPCSTRATYWIILHVCFLSQIALLVSDSEIPSSKVYNLIF